MKVVKDKHGDKCEVSSATTSVFMGVEDGDGSWVTMAYTPQQARELAKQLKRAAREAEA